ncbi:MAG TPA: hypothetical protein VJB11_01160 [archaeon]|nr:hypothetical protein [archaeon]
MKKIKCHDALIRHKNTTEKSRIFCDEIELMNNHLMFYKNGSLVFKVWLGKKYNNAKKALEAVGIEKGYE